MRQHFRTLTQRNSSIFQTLSQNLERHRDACREVVVLQLISMPTIVFVSLDRDSLRPRCP